MCRQLQTFGKEDHLGRGDYLVVDDNYGWQTIQVEVHRLHMLAPHIISALRNLLDGFPGWQISVVVDIPGEEIWPPMGLFVRQHEIVNGLRRQYFPPEYRKFSYQDSRAGTQRD